MFKHLKKRYLLYSLILTITLLIAVLGVSFNIGFVTPKDSGNILTNGEFTTSFTIGNPVYASGSPDYICDGIADDIQFQAAMNALPAVGGKLVVLSGTYSFNNNVTRLIDNVTIEGMGNGTYITLDSVNPSITAGGNNWIFSNLKFDAGSVNMGATTGWSWQSVTINATYYAYRTADSVTGSSWDIPTGRGATYVIAANDAPAHMKAQADYVCDGTADDVEIQAAFAAVAATGVRGSVSLVGTFATSATINAVSNVDVSGPATITVTSNSNIHGVVFDGVTNAIWDGITINRAGTTNGSQIFAVQFTKTVDSTTKLHNCVVNNSVISTGSDCFAVGIYIGSGSGTFYSTEPDVSGCVVTCSGNGAGGVYGMAIYHGMGEPKISNTEVITTAAGSAVYLTEWIGNAWLDNVTGRGFLNGFSTDGGSYTLTSCNFHAGAGSSSSAGIRLGNQGSGKIYNTNGYSYPAQYSNGMTIVADNEAYIEGGYFGPERHDQLKGWSVTAAVLPDNGQFRPDFTEYSWSLAGIFTLYITGTNPGVTLDIGTTVGGNQIASAIDISAGGVGKLLSVPISAHSLTAGAYLYATVSAVYTGKIYVAYTASYDYLGCYGVLATGGVVNGKTTFKNSYIMGAVTGSDIAVYFNETKATNNLLFDNCYIRSQGGWALAYATIVQTRCPFNNCTFDLGGGTLTNYLAYFKTGLNTFLGYIAPGEIRTYSGTIATLTENAFNSLDNPFGQAVRVLDLQINVTTGATATTPDLDCGIGSSATTDYTTLFDDLPGETIGFYTSTIATPGAQTVPQLWASGSGNRYLNMSIKGAAATGMVASYTVTVMGN
jgi:hypothetical protein